MMKTTSQATVIAIKLTKFDFSQNDSKLILNINWTEV